MTKQEALVKQAATARDALYAKEAEMAVVRTQFKELAEERKRLLSRFSDCLKAARVDALNPVEEMTQQLEDAERQYMLYHHL